MILLLQNTRINWVYKITKLLLFLFAVVMRGDLYGQQINESENLFVTAYTNENGLRQSMVSQVCQDQTGLIWMVTGDGLHYFDGLEFKSFRVPYNNVYSQSDNVMRYLAESKPGHFILSSSSSLLDFNTASGQFKIIYRKEGIYPIVFNAYIDKHPLVWMKGAGFCLVKSDRLLPLKFIPELNAEIPSSFIPIKAMRSCNNEILISGEKGILAVQLNNRDSDSVFKAKWIPVADCRVIEKTSKGKILILAGNRIFVLQKDGKLILFADTRLKGAQNMFTDEGENIWLTDKSRSKIYRLSEGRIKEMNLLTRIGKSTELLTPSIISIFEDREHNLWFGTDGNGVLLYSPEQVQFQKSNIGFIRCIAAFNKNIWVGTFNNGLWELSPDLGSSKRVRPAHFGNSTYFLDLMPDQRGRLWVVTRSGIEVIDNRGEIIWKYPNQCSLAKFICQGRDSLVIVSDNQMLTFKTSEHPCFYKSNNYIDTRAFLNVDNYFWIGSPYGLYRYNRKPDLNQAQELIWDKVRLSSTPVNGLSFHNGLVWVATGNGIECYHPDGSIHELPACFKSLKNEIFYSIIPDDRGRFWVSGNNGIACIIPSDNRVIFFNSKNNLQSPEFNSNAAISTSGGNLYFGGIQGLNHINTSDFIPDKEAPEVHLISLFVSDTANSAGIPQANMVFKLSRLAPHIGGKVFSDDYLNAGSLLYSFYLQGYQSEWSKPSNNAGFTYRNLPPGKYSLFVRCADPYMNWSKPAKMLTFTILPAFYTTWWFMLMFAILLITVTILVVKKVQRLRYTNRLREIEHEFAIEKERLRISKDMHDAVGASLTRISILSELAKKQQNEQEKALKLIEQISEISGDVVDEMSEIIWAMNPRNDTFDSFTSYIREYASSYLESAGIEGTFSFPDLFPLQPMSSELRRNLFLTVKEALHNIVKHSGATDVHMILKFEKLSLRIKIDDNGKGFDPDKIRSWGNGLTNMRKRLEELEGSFLISSEEGKGTKIEFSAMLQENKKSH